MSKISQFVKDITISTMEVVVVGNTWPSTAIVVALYPKNI